MTEAWLPIDGHPDYQVSSLGRIARLTDSCRHKAGFILKTRPHGKAGYISVSLQEGRRAIRHNVHALVLKAFVGPPPAGHEARHLDGDTANPRLDNLCWGTKQENADDKAAHGKLKGSNHPLAKLSDEDVIVLRSRYVPGDPDNGANPISREIGMSPAATYKMLVGKSWKHIPLAQTA